MSTPQGEFAGGADQLRPVTPDDALHPVTVERVALSTVLHESARQWAPGAASADWQDWPASGTNPRATHIPPLVRYGVLRGGSVVLGPLLGEAHVAVGDPNLTAPYLPAKVPLMSYGDTKQAKAQAEEVARLRNQHRLATLKKERRLATVFARNVVTRTLGAMMPGTVDLTVYDPQGLGQDFRDFGELGREGLYHVTPPHGLSALLEELHQDIMRMNGHGLGRYPDFRTGATLSPGLPRHWKIAVLLGNGDKLSQQDQARLTAIVQQGVTCGISLITHGLHMPKDPSLHQVSIDPDTGRAVSPSAGPFAFGLDRPAPASVVRRTASAAAAYPGAGQIPPIALHPHMPLPPQPLPGVQYREIVTERVAALRQAERLAAEYPKHFPFLTADVLAESITPSTVHYLDIARRAAENPDVAVSAMAEFFGQPGGSTTQKLQAWALLQLVRSAPGQRNLAWTQVQYGAEARRTAEVYTDGLAQVVAITQHHGIQQLPEAMRPYIVPLLPEDPPAWAFQLVADAATRSGRQPTQPRRPKAVVAVARHLEDTWNLEMPLATPEGEWLHPELARCFAEAEVLRLYDYYKQAAPELQAILSTRAQQRLEHAEPERLPRNLRTAYEECLAYLAEAGVQPGSSQLRAALGQLASKLRRPRP